MTNYLLEIFLILLKSFFGDPAGSVGDRIVFNSDVEKIVFISAYSEGEFFKIYESTSNIIDLNYNIREVHNAFSSQLPCDGYQIAVFAKGYLPYLGCLKGQISNSYDEIKINLVKGYLDVNLYAIAKSNRDLEILKKRVDQAQSIFWDNNFSINLRVLNDTVFETNLEYEQRLISSVCDMQQTDLPRSPNLVNLYYNYTNSSFQCDSQIFIGRSSADHMKNTITHEIGHLLYLCERPLPNNIMTCLFGDQSYKSEDFVYSQLYRMAFFSPVLNSGNMLRNCLRDSDYNSNYFCPVCAEIHIPTTPMSYTVPNIRNTSVSHKQVKKGVCFNTKYNCASSCVGSHVPFVYADTSLFLDRFYEIIDGKNEFGLAEIVGISEFYQGQRNQLVNDWEQKREYFNSFEQVEDIDRFFEWKEMNFMREYLSNYFTLARDSIGMDFTIDLLDALIVKEDSLDLNYGFSFESMMSNL